MQARGSFRPDVEGLRAIAVLAVVLYHAHVGALGGGYVGVDVFFVLSGFLITGLLWRELTQRGRISFATFYGRRARRLLPASVLVVIVTVLASSKWLSPLEAATVTKDGIASALYVPNYRLALQSTNYLTSTGLVSPLQHYWSLGVEEQFYLLWPVLLLLASLGWRRSRRVSLAAAATVLVVIGSLSLALSVWLTKVSQPWAFFSLPTRAWELVAGGVVALMAPKLRRWHEAGAAILGWAGLAVILWSVIHLSASTPFPGTAALAPVGGTVAMLISGCAEPRLGPILILGRKPFQVIGKLSYSWYLWHWPVLVLAPAVAGHALALWQNLALASFSGVLALATVVVVEVPIRFSPWVAARAARSLIIGATASAVAVISSVAIAYSLPSLQGHGLAPVATIAATAFPSAKVAAAPAKAEAVTSTTVDPAAAAMSNALAPVVAAIAHAVSTQNVPSNLTPSLSRAAGDKARPFVDGCLDTFTDATVRQCTYGAVHSATTVFLFGDSHAAQWFPAIDTLANAHGWRLVTLTKATCPPVSIPVFSPILGRHFHECDDWRNRVLARIQAEKPALVILGVARHYDTQYHFSVYSPQWIQGLAAMVTSIRQSGSRVAVMGAIPKPAFFVPSCLSAHLTTAVACTEPLSQVIDPQGVAAEQAAVVAAGGAYLDTRPWICTATTCAVVLDNLLMWRDDNHLTTTFTTWLAPVIGAEMAQAVPIT